MTNPTTETGEKGMTHEAGIEAAARSDAAVDGRDFDGLSRSDKNRYLLRPRLAIQAYLSASGMVLVPREPTKEMIKAGDDAGAKAWRTGEHMATAIIRAGISSASESFELRALA